MFDEFLQVNLANLNWKGRALERMFALGKVLKDPRHVRARVAGVYARRRRAARAAASTGGTTTFFDAFWDRYDRPPRILHVGNIANNAYLSAKLLNESGFDCDVICHDYYHVMGCPEWEEAEFDVERVDQLRPDWASMDLGGYQRPTWFAQGPQQLCIDYLSARRRGDARRAQTLWRRLSVANRTRPSTHGVALARLTDGLRRAWRRVSRRRFGTVRSPTVRRTLSDLRRRFKSNFPRRGDTLTSKDWLPYASVLDSWAELFSHYDIVQAYSTDVVYPLLTGFRPYLGFEHGTLRDFTLGDSAICRLTALGYREADHVLITNGDCLEYAERIGVQSFTPMLHPIDDARIAQVAAAYDELHREHGVKYLFLCPLRHDWQVKGTDKYIRALPALAERIGRDFRVLMTEWGAQLEESRTLARSLGVDELISWIRPVHRSGLIRLQKSVDVVFDQIALPHFGATAPQAIAAGVPVIMSYDPASTEWIIPEPAPVLCAWTPADVVLAVETALQPEWRGRYARDATRWFAAHHSGAEAVRRLAAAYHSVCDTTGIL